MFSADRFSVTIAAILQYNPGSPWNGAEGLKVYRYCFYELIPTSHPPLRENSRFMANWKILCCPILSPPTGTHTFEDQELAHFFAMVGVGVATGRAGRGGQAWATKFQIHFPYKLGSRRATPAVLMKINIKCCWQQPIERTGEEQGPPAPPATARAPSATVHSNGMPVLSLPRKLQSVKMQQTDFNAIQQLCTRAQNVLPVFELQSLTEFMAQWASIHLKRCNFRLSLFF